MANPLISFVRGNSYYASKQWLPLVRGNGYTTQDGGGADPEPVIFGPGRIASFKTYEESPLLSLVCNIAPAQSGVGDPSPTNIRPLSARSSLTAHIAGENLFKVDDASATGGGVTFTASNGDSITISGNVGGSTAAYAYALSNPFELKAGDTITVFLVGKTDRSGNFSFRLMNGSTAIGTVSYASNLVSATYTANANVTITKFEARCAANKTMDFDCKVMAYVGTAATATTSIPTQPGTVYGGSIDLVNGDIVVTMESVDLGSLSWNYNESRAYFYASMPTDAIAAGSETPNGYCDIFKVNPTIRAADFYAADKVVTYCNTSLSTSKRVFIRDTDYTDKDAFGAAMSGHTLVYLLANPVAYQTDGQTISALNGNNSVWQKSGDNVTVEVKFVEVEP